MKRNTYTSILLIFILVLFSISNGQAQGTIQGVVKPPAPSTTNNDDQTASGAETGQGDDYSYLFPSCVQNDESVEVSIYIDYNGRQSSSNNRTNGDGSSNGNGSGAISICQYYGTCDSNTIPPDSVYEYIDIVLKVYENDMLLYTETKSAIGENGLLEFIHFGYFDGHETTKTFTFDVVTRFAGGDEDQIESIEFPVQFGLGCQSDPLLHQVVPYPNPTYGVGNLKYTLGQQATVMIWRYSSNGGSGILIFDDKQHVGEHTINLLLPSAGTYYYKIYANDGGRMKQLSGTILKRSHNLGGGINQW